MKPILKYILIALAAGIFIAYVSIPGALMGCLYVQKNHEFNEVKRQADELDAKINAVEPDQEKVEALKEEINAVKQKFGSIVTTAQGNAIKLSRTTSQKGNAGEPINVYLILGKDLKRTGLTFHWSADAGAFDDPTAQSTTWHQPEEVGKYALTCEIKSQDGAPVKVDSEPVRVTSYPVLKPAPAAEFTSRRLTGDGEFSLSTYTHGKVVLLNWWATW